MSQKFYLENTIVFSGLHVSAIAIWPFIFVREPSCCDDATLMQHERIHHVQQLELGLVAFYLWYALEYIVRVAQYKQHWLAYKNISFEREAFLFEQKEGYLLHRKTWAFANYLFKSEA